MNSTWRKCAFVIGLLLLTGCASRIDCDVVAYHELGEPDGETVRLVHQNPDQTYGPQFELYSGKIAEALSKIGYVVTDRVYSDLTFVIDYGVTIGSTEIVEPTNCSMRYHFINRNYDDPYIYRSGCSRPKIRTHTFYVHYLEVDITKFAPLKGYDETVYEGRVYSNHHKQDLPDMMPYLIAAMFDNFPGESGVVKSVTFEQKNIPQK